MDKVCTITSVAGRRSLAGLLLLLLLMPSSGCRLCADCEDLAYPAYGGAWQRTRRDAGRVGSLFDPAGARASELVSRDTPGKPDELERERQNKTGQGINRSPDQDPQPGDEPADPEANELREKADGLRDRKLEDIEEKKEDELRQRKLDDIDVKIIPGDPLPPVLR